MRRSKQKLADDECWQILKRNTHGILSLSGDDGYPYGVPLSYDLDEESESALFHCARTGHKLDAIARSSKACFTVVDADDVMPEELTTYFRSVICFGRAEVLEGDEMLKRIRSLGRRYWPGAPDDALEKEVSSGLARMRMIRFTIEHMSGKEAIELVRMRGMK